MNNPIYEPRGRAREYGELAVNIYTGCNHGCSYCYAPAVLHRGQEEFAEVQPRPGIVEAVRRQLEREKKTGRTIFLCFTCDPYPAEIDTTPTRAVIQAIKESGNHVRILTKGGDRARRDFDLLDSGDYFGVTFTTDNLFYPAAEEPKAANTAERLATLEQAKYNGVQTWVSCEPVLYPSAVFSLIRNGWYIDLFKIGKLNHAAPPPEIVKAGGWAAFGEEAEHLCREHGRAYYIKEDLRAEMEKARGNIMDPKEQVEMLKGAIGATAEMALLFYRATIQVGATMEEALKLTQAYLAAMIHGNNKDPQQEGADDE